MIMPAADLAAFVAGYCYCDDPEGVFDSVAITAAPQAGACLCIQLGDDVDTDFRDRRPRLSYAGVQARLRAYRPIGRARSVVVFLTALGTVCFLPSSGRDLFDEGMEAGSIIGDHAVLALRQYASAADDESTACRAIDDWLRPYFTRRAPSAAQQRLAAAMTMVGHEARPIASVARHLDLSERQLERCFMEHLGLPPKRYQQIGRVAASVHAALSGQGDALEGYADQAHQIRSWKHYLGFTPGHMRKTGPSPVGEMYLAEARRLPRAWAHYL
jgi:AraC-like DNA-binding protein